MDSTINTEGPPGRGDVASQTGHLISSPPRTYAPSFSASSTSSPSEYEKPVLAPAPATSSRLARFHPKTWSRKMRIFMLTGLILAFVALIPALVVPLTLSRPHRIGPSAVVSGKPLNVNTPATQPLANNTALRIMPLGASITYGLLSTDKNGYREDLLNLIQQGGNSQVTYVGSRRSGDMAENAVEGWPGLRIDEVLPKARDAVPKYKPNVILVNAGTNDCVQDWDIDSTTQQSTVEPELTANATFTVGTRMRMFVEDLFTMVPDATVIMSTLILNQDAATNKRVDDANGKFRSVAAALQADGRRVVLADMDASAGGPNITTMADVTHPNDVGYALMANRWYVALTEASSRGMIVAPSG